jgi:hypothetical protein
MFEVFALADFGANCHSLDQCLVNKANGRCGDVGPTTFLKIKTQGV